MTEAATSVSALDDEWNLGRQDSEQTLNANCSEPTAEEPTRGRAQSDGFLIQELFSADFDTITAVDENSPEHRIAQVHKFVDSFNSGRVDGIMMVVHELFHEDVVLRDPNLGTYTGDWNAIRDYWDGLMKSFDNHFVKADAS